MTPVTLRAPLAAALALAAGASLADDVADLVATDRRMQHAFVTRDLAALDEMREHGRWRNLHAHASKAVDTVAAP